MTFLVRLRLAGAGLAAVLGLALIGGARAQEQPPAQQVQVGIIQGEVDRCSNGTDTPASQVSVGIQGGSSNLVQTDAAGDFVMALAPGQYTIVATASDGSTANRQYVPVDAGETLDIGVLEIGVGCGNDASSIGLALPSLPTFTPTATEAPAPAAPPAAPAATATPVPATPVAPEPEAPATEPTSGGD